MLLPWIVAGFVLIILGYIVFKKLRENYQLMAVPLFFPIPPKINTNFPDYVTHENADWGKLCPSTLLPDGKYQPCEKREDCGPAEVCFMYDSERNYCKCDVANACVYDGVC